MNAINPKDTVCPTCKEVHPFEGVLEEVQNGRGSLMFVRCTNCKTAIGVMENVVSEMTANRMLSSLGQLHDKIDMLLKK